MRPRRWHGLMSGEGSYLASWFPSAPAAGGYLAVHEPGHDGAIAGLAVLNRPTDFLRGSRKIQLDLTSRLASDRREFDSLISRQIQDGVTKLLALLIPFGTLLDPLHCGNIDFAKSWHVEYTCPVVHRESYVLETPPAQKSRA
jgi:hypothetical protein